MFRKLADDLLFTLLPKCRIFAGHWTITFWCIHFNADNDGLATPLYFTFNANNCLLHRCLQLPCKADANGKFAILMMPHNSLCTIGEKINWNRCMILNDNRRLRVCVVFENTQVKRPSLRLRQPMTNQFVDHFNFSIINLRYRIWLDDIFALFFI